MELVIFPSTGGEGRGGVGAVRAEFVAPVIGGLGELLQPRPAPVAGPGLGAQVARDQVGGAVAQMRGEPPGQPARDAVVQHLRRRRRVVQAACGDRRLEHGVGVVAGQLGRAQQALQRAERVVGRQALAIGRRQRASSGEPIERGGQPGRR